MVLDTKPLIGAALGGVVGAVAFELQGPQGYARRVQRASKKGHGTFIHPAIQWAIIGAVGGLIWDATQSPPTTSTAPTPT